MSPVWKTVEKLGLGNTSQIKNLSKDYNKLIKPETTRHEKKCLLTSSHYKTKAIGKILNQLNDVRRKCMAQVMFTGAEDESHKSLLEQERKEPKAELDTY